MSTNVDSAVLPKNEGQARPLTRLKSAKHRKQAWLLALKTARAEARPVTARDVETAVYAVARNGKDRLTGQYWVTPPELYARLERDYGPFDFDPCP
ncbi:MAG: hypothetical protein ACLQM8_23780 [Limisphaerales bacterium]